LQSKNHNDSLLLSYESFATFVQAIVQGGTVELFRGCQCRAFSGQWPFQLYDRHSVGSNWWPLYLTLQCTWCFWTKGEEMRVHTAVLYEVNDSRQKPEAWI